MECYLRTVVEDTKRCIQNFMVKELINRIEDQARGQGTHICSVFVRENFCRRALVTYFNETYHKLLAELFDDNIQ